MNSSFSISKISYQGLGGEIVQGRCSVEEDLALVKSSDGWTLYDTRRERLPEGKVIRGAFLQELMRSVANGESGPPSSLSEREYRVLVANGRFCRFCRLVPGLETEEQVKSRLRREAAVERAYRSGGLFSDV